MDDDADPSKHALAKRFGLNQKNKVRVIDDCTVGGLNKTIGVVEKYRIHAMDEISAYLAWMLTRCQARCRDSNGSSFQLLGRTFDLKAAYKQFGVNLSDRDLLRIAVRDTDCGRVRFLGINSLPFGAVGSVGGFLTVSMAVWFLGVVGLRLAWCAYFDDYTIRKTVHGDKRYRSGRRSLSASGPGICAGRFKSMRLLDGFPHSGS